MNPWIAKAEHALRTGQPNLATLYMRRGLKETPAGRQWLAFRDAQQTIIEAWQAIADAYRPLLDAFAQAGAAMNQTDVALAGPSKGGQE